MTYVELKQRLMPLYGEQETQAILRMILEIRFGLSHADILRGKVTHLSADDTEELEKIIQRLEKNEPVQYILGQADFCGRTFHVNPNVLIPRPETEELCLWITETVREQSSQPTILDIGTGSGCIAVTLALELPGSKVEAWDISRQAIEVARQNAKQLGAPVTFVENDIQKVADSPINWKSLAEGKSKWDIIVSNPPYITTEERKDMEANVLAWEPHEALFVPNNNPLFFYELIVRYAIRNMNDGGMVFFEINPLFEEQVVQTLAAHAFTDIIVREDIYGKRRFVRGTRT